MLLFTEFPAKVDGNVENISFMGLEQKANKDPLNINMQYELLQTLSEKYPEAVIQRFELNNNFIVDERCAILYLQCLQRTGQMNAFNFS